MIKSITVTNYLGDSIKLDLARPELSGFAVTSITGLGPGKATINTSEITTTDGGLFNSARLPVRNIVISLRYMWWNSIEDSRQRSYKYFPIKKQVSLLIETDNRIVETSGYVESNDPTIFSKESGSDISIICPDPFFYSGGTVTTKFDGVESQFEFPFENDDQSSNTPAAMVRERLELPTDYSGAIDIVSNPSGVYYGTHNIISALGLAQGTFTGRGLTITIDGSHFTVNGTPDGIGFFNFGTGEFVTTQGTERHALPVGTYRLAIYRTGPSNSGSFGVISIYASSSRSIDVNNSNTSQASAIGLVDGQGVTAPQLYFYSGSELKYEGNLVLVRGSVSDYDAENSVVSKIEGTGSYDVDGYVWTPDADNTEAYHYVTDPDGDKFIEMSSLLTVAERSIVYDGDAETGVTILLHATGEARNITLTQLNADANHTMRLNIDLVEGDDIIISTVQRNKYARLIRGGTTANILGHLGKNIEWFRLVRGENVFAYTAEDGLANLSVTIENRVVYEGV